MSKRVFKVKAKPQYHDSFGGKSWPCDTVREGDIITIDENEEYLKDRIDAVGDVCVHEDETTGWAGYVGMDSLEEITPEPLADWERELLTVGGKFLLGLTEDEIKSVADGSPFISARDKARALIPKKKITIELDEADLNEIVGALEGRGSRVKARNKLYAAQKKD